MRLVYREFHDHREPRHTFKTQGKTEESGVSLILVYLEQNNVVVDIKESLVQQGYSLARLLNTHH
jgi:hypothetical protein